MGKKEDRIAERDAAFDNQREARIGGELNVGQSPESSSGPWFARDPKEGQEADLPDLTDAPVLEGGGTVFDQSAVEEEQVPADFVNDPEGPADEIPSAADDPAVPAVLGGPSE